MCYTNAELDLFRIFWRIPIYKAEQINDTPSKAYSWIANFGEVWHASSKWGVRGVPFTRSIFVNQAMIYITMESEGELYNINVMISRNALKLVGCRHVNDAYVVVDVLWRDYIRRSGSDAWSFRTGMGESKEVHFLFWPVMLNVTSKGDFPVYRSRLCQTINQNYAHEGITANFESSCDTNVRVNMIEEKRDWYRFACLAYPANGTGDGKWRVFKTNPYEKNGKSMNGIYQMSFIVFSSAQVTISGRILSEMERCYTQYIKILERHRDEIEEKIGIDLNAFASFQITSN